jgi:hypothetical protein
MIELVPLIELAMKIIWYFAETQQRPNRTRHRGSFPHRYFGVKLFGALCDSATPGRALLNRDGGGRDPFQ